MENKPSINSILSHYRIIEKLGAGGMGEVYLAHDTKLNRKVAIKLLPLDSALDDQARRRLIREARAAASLDHPNICTVHEVSEDNGRLFIAMQFVEGETLAARIARKPLELSESVELSIQMADALVAAHAKGIIHRDLKPQNIMVTGRHQIKMLDFGLAKIVDDQGALDPEAETRSLLTASGMIIGTVPYMSPEQVKGEMLDARSDMFSFGTVFYEMITCRQPFAAKTGAETISAILTSEPPLLGSPVPSTVERIVRTCLEKDRDRRYQTALQVGGDLQIALRDCQSKEQVTSDNEETPTVHLRHSQLTAKWNLLATSPRLAILATVVVLALIGSVYAIYQRRSGSTASSDKSVDAQAYDDYVRGHVLVSSENREDNESAINFLERATSANPNLARAWADLARAYNRKAFFYAPDSEKKQLNINAEVAVEKALKLDPGLAEAHVARGLILWTHTKRFPHEQAVQSYKRALELDPNLGDAHHHLAVVYFHIGLFDKAWVEIEQALKIDPSNTLARFRFGNINIYRGRYEETLAVLKSTPREANPALVDRKWLEVAADDGFPCYPFFETDANLNNLHKDERFIALMSKLRKQFEQYQATL